MKKTIICFDIVSSSKIIEELSKSNEVDAWKNLISKLGLYIEEQDPKDKMIIYKFIGDGWIIILDQLLDLNFIRGYLSSLLKKYLKLFDDYVKPRLEIDIKNIGITAGVDIGEIFEIAINEKKEWIGRPINIASRLQGVVSIPKDNVINSFLISERSFNDLNGGSIEKKLVKKDKRRTLKNIADDDKFKCHKVLLD